MNQKEAALGLSEDASWHAKFRGSAYVFVGGVPFDLTEGDLLAVFAQYGEVVDVNLVRDKATGKSKGFTFVTYEDQRSTILAVDNLNGAKVLGRIIRVDHVEKYKKKEDDEEELHKKREERGVCYAFQKGECNRGDACKYSHDEQRNANTGWGSKEDDQKWEHDRHRGPQNKGESRGICYAFQKGECSRGDSCRFSHDEQLSRAVVSDMLSRKANAVAELPADFPMMSRGMQTLIEVLGRTAMQDGSMTMIHQRATKISLTGIKKRRDQGVVMIIPQDQSCTGTEILGRDMAIETQRIVTGTGTGNPPREQEATGREAMTGEEKFAAVAVLVRLMFVLVQGEQFC